MKYRRQGSGFRINEGFFRSAETGYAIRESNYGCPAIWSGFFADNFNRSESDLGSMWFQIGAGLYADAGLLKNSDIRDLGYVICPNVPTGLVHVSAEARWKSGTYDVNVDGAGPAVYCALDINSRTYCYCVRVFNFSTDVTVSNRLSLRRVSADVEATLANYSMADNPPFGPLNIHTYRIEANLEAGTHADDVRLKVYVDGAQVISVLDENASRVLPSFQSGGGINKAAGRFGFAGGDLSTYDRYIARQLP